MSARALIAQWREDAAPKIPDTPFAHGARAALKDCAEELEAALAAAPPISEDHEMANGCLNMIAEQLEKLGTDMSKTPPMFYPEAICATVAKYAAPWKLKGEPAPSLLTDEERARLTSALAAVDDLWARDNFTGREYASAHDGLRSALEEISGGGLMEHTARYLLAADARLRGGA